MTSVLRGARAAASALRGRLFGSRPRAKTLSTASEMRFASALSTEASTKSAVDACIAAAAPTGVSLLFVWTCGHDPAEVLNLLDAHDPQLRAVTLGCSAYALVSDGGGRPRETEREARALSVFAAWLPNVEVRGFAVESAQLPAFARLDDLLKAERETSFLLFPSPGFASAAFIRSLDSLFPHACKLGAVAFAPGDQPALLGGGLPAEDMGGEQPPARVFSGSGGVQTSGAVGVALTGDVFIDVVLLSALGFPSSIGAMSARFKQHGGGAEGEAAHVRLETLGGHSFNAVAAVCSEALECNRMRFGAQLLPEGTSSEDAPWVPLTLIWEGGEGHEEGEDDEEVEEVEVEVVYRGPEGQRVAADSEAVAIAGALVAPCPYAPSIAAANASYALAHATAELAAARGALLFSSCERSAPRSPLMRRGLFMEPGVDVAALCAAADVARTREGTPLLPVGGLQASAPIAPIAHAARTHVHRGSAVVALFRPRWEAAAAAGGGGDAVVRYSCEADIARHSMGDPSVASLLEKGLTLVPTALEPGGWQSSHTSFPQVQRNGAELEALLPVLPASLRQPPLSAAAQLQQQLQRRVLFPGITREYELVTTRDIFLGLHCAQRGADAGVVLSSPSLVSPGVVGHLVAMVRRPDGSCVLTLRGGERFLAGRSCVVPLGFGVTMVEAHTFHDVDRGSGTAALLLKALLADLRHDPALREEAAELVRALTERCESERGLCPEEASFALCDRLDLSVEGAEDVALMMLCGQSSVDRLDLLSELFKMGRE